MLIEGSCYSYHHMDDNYEIYFNNQLIKSNKVMEEKNEFTAEEARKLSGSINNDNASKQLNIIFGLIKQECNKGENCVIYTGDMLTSVKKHLEKLGYSLKHFGGYQRNDSYSNISWFGK